MTAEITSRAVDSVWRGAGRASIRAKATAIPAVSANAAISHNGRVSHQTGLLGSGRAMPVRMAKIADAPAIVSSTGMCHR
ncbi:hypothetical protein GCM10007198_15350 [Microbacterium aerolatum]|uniref:Uncharacterized protein n=1 Tax=Microbacterium aerolatum TaxID=153731 RepID=A0A511AHD3_9MICO|nr:hypothetical protein MAE01_27660 [Microbacterium aerolatum]GGB25839.1 hypothetical protein GCM10007198_15350 [Microbacterium aerolatum]